MKNRLCIPITVFAAASLGACLVAGNGDVWQSRAANAQATNTQSASAQTAGKSDDMPLGADGIKAVHTLEKAGYFAVGNVGIANITSESELALRVLLKEKNGAVALRGLLKTASPAGKLYALLGLRQTGTNAEIAQLTDGLRDKKGIVPVLHGCLGSGEPLGSLATQIEKGSIVLPAKQGEPTITPIAPVSPVTSGKPTAK